MRGKDREILLICLSAAMTKIIAFSSSAMQRSIIKKHHIHSDLVVALLDSHALLPNKREDFVVFKSAWLPKYSEKSRDSCTPKQGRRSDVQVMREV